MKQIAIAELKEIIERIGRASALGPCLRHVAVKPTADGVGGQALRVTLRVDHPQTLSWDVVKPLVTEIEDTVLEIDDRFPVVYFPD